MLALSGWHAAAVDTHDDALDFPYDYELCLIEHMYGIGGKYHVGYGTVSQYACSLE